MLKKIFTLVLAALLLFSGCGKSKTLGFDIAAGVDSFDPQLAESDSELVIVKNCYQGLLDKDESGKLILGAAESMDVSDDGLVYTFKLRENIFWSDGVTPVIADDFLFAFQRLFSPETSAPFRSDFYNILNAEKVLSGEKPMSSLGVRLIDEYTLQITLNNADPLFPDLLTTAGAMPCSRSFFESTRGRYGLGREYTIFNGAYYVRRINNYSYVLSPNEQSPIVNKKYENIYLFVKDDPKTGAVSRLLDETVDAAVISPSDISKLLKDDFDIHESENTVWVLAFNTKDEVLSNGNIRSAISYAIDKSLPEKKISDNFRIADAYVPGSVTLNGNNYRKTVGGSFSGFGFDPKLAAELFKNGLEELGLSKLPTLTMICTEEFIPAMGLVQKSIQDNLAVFINLVPVTEEELSAALSSGNYDLALTSITPQYDNPDAVLSFFTDADNFTGFYSDSFSSAVNAASYMKDYGEMAEGYALAEQMLLQSAPAVPLFYETSYFAVSSKISGLDYSVFGGHSVFRFCR